MEHVSYKIASFFIRIDEGEISNILLDVVFTFETVAVRVSTVGEDVVKEATQGEDVDAFC